MSLSGATLSGFDLDDIGLGSAPAEPTCLLSLDQTSLQLAVVPEPQTAAICATALAGFLPDPQRNPDGQVPLPRASIAADPPGGQDILSAGPLRPTA